MILTTIAGPNWTLPARGPSWAMESTFALPEAIALTWSLLRGAGTVLITALGSQRSRWRQSASFPPLALSAGKCYDGYTDR